MNRTPSLFYLDDEQDLCDIVSAYCSVINVAATTFIDAEEALKACKLSPPAIFFIDYRLTDTVGDEVALCVPEGVIKVLVTGELTVPSLANFAHVLTKPFQYKQFTSLVAKCLGKELPLAE